MGSHIIVAFLIVNIVGVAIDYQFADEVFQISANVGIGIFGNYQGGTGMFNKYMAQTCHYTGATDQIINIGGNFYG